MVLSELRNRPGFMGTTERLLCWFEVHTAKPLLTLGPEDGNSTTRPGEAEVGASGAPWRGRGLVTPTGLFPSWHLVPEFPGSQVSAQLVPSAKWPGPCRQSHGVCQLILALFLVHCPPLLSSGTLEMSSVALSTDTLMPRLSVSQLEQGFGVLQLGPAPCNLRAQPW